MASQGRLGSKKALEAANSYDHDTLWFLAKGYKNWPANTARVYKSGIREWITFCAEHEYDVLAPPPEADQEFLDQLILVNGLQAQTARLRYSATRFLYRRLAEWGLVNRPFAEPLKYSRPTRKETYTRDELERLLKVADWQEQLVIWWHLEARQRLHTLLKLTWSAIDDMTIATVNGEANIVLGPRMRQALADAPKRDSHVLSFRSQQRLNQRFKDLCEDAEVEYKGVDVMRYYSGATPDA